MASERLRTIWPLLISARHLGVVGIDPCSGIRSPINVAGAKHDLCESREPGAHTCRFWADNFFHRVVCWPGDNSSARISFDRGGEKAEREGRLGGRGEHLECKVIR